MLRFGIVSGGQINRPHTITGQRLPLVWTGPLTLRTGKIALRARSGASIWPQHDDVARAGATARAAAVSRPYENAKPAAKPAVAIEARFARHLLKQRRLRESMLGSDLFADPVWDMLLDLYAAEVEGILVSVTSLCMASAVPSTTAQRCLKDMLHRGLVVRQADSRDGRRINVRLAPSTRDSIASTLQALMAVDSRFHAAVGTITSD